jgi:hypothetical protein
VIHIHDVEQRRTELRFSARAYIDLDPWTPRRPPIILTESRSLAGALRNLAIEYRVLLAATNGQCSGFLHTDIAPALRPRQRALYLGDYDLAGPTAR